MAPLLQPADSCLLILDPLAGHTARLDPTRQPDLPRSLGLLLAASLAAAVPIHIAFSDGPAKAEEWALSPRPLPQARVHGLGTAASSWTCSGLHEALAAQNRNSL